MSRSFFVAFCWMMFLGVIATILSVGVLAFYIYAAMILLGKAWGVSPLLAIGIVGFLAMTVWSGYILNRR